MNAAQRKRHAALLKAAGYEDSPALTTDSGNGDIPQGRELSFAWLAGTVMTGLTSVLLMGAALYVSFQGQDTFSTAIAALQGESSVIAGQASLFEKTDRVKPVALTRSELEIVEASIRETVGGRAILRTQPFLRLRATLATAGTALSDDIPAYDPVALLNVASAEETDAPVISTEIYGAQIEGQVAMHSQDLNLAAAPSITLSDAQAADFVRQAVEGAYTDSGEAVYFSYAASDQSFRDLGEVSGGIVSGIAENVSIIPKSDPENLGDIGRTERIVTIREAESLESSLTKNGFTPAMIKAITATLRNAYPQTTLPIGARLRILMGPSPASDSVIPYRLSIYVGDRHVATVARTDKGRYVLALAPPAIDFPEEDTEEISVSSLPTLYRSIWETGRKHELPDDTIRRIVAMYAYDLDLSKKIDPGDSIEMLEGPPDTAGKRELLYVAISTGNAKREFYRFRASDGTVDYFDPQGQTGKRFLNRRPLKGGGRISSRFGYRKHPIYKTYRLHSGVDLAAPYKTPIYAGGDGVIARAGWVSGYGRLVEIKHVNGYSTRYGHMSKIASGIKPGTRVRQGQVIGYVGSTGVSSGNHLHYEIRINGTPVDPLSVKLPRDKSLPASEDRAFERTIAQIQDLMARDPAPVTIASLN